MNLTDPHFESVYNPQLLQTLEKKFGPIYHHHVDLDVSTPWMLTLMQKMSKKSRRGEVVMVVPNEQGHIWLHTKSFYGAGVYRLMTGGLEPGELPHLAFERELIEETGFESDIDRCVAVITYTLTDQETTQLFVSYVFMTKPSQGTPKPTDESEAITGFKAVPVPTLNDVAQKLSSLEGERADWGIFRAVAHEVVQAQLQKS